MIDREIIEPEPRKYSFPKKIWDLLSKYHITEVSDGVDASQEFRDNVATVHEITKLGFDGFPKHVCYAYNFGKYSKTLLEYKFPNASIRSQNVYGWLMFHLMLYSHNNGIKINTIPSSDAHLMFCALQEILDAPTDDRLMKNL